MSSAAEALHLDPSQLTLPQIAVAVASGRLRLADAEGEFRRRPENELPLWQRRAPVLVPSDAPATTEVLRALDLTRKELRKATRNLEVLAARFEELVAQAARLQAAPTSTPRTQTTPQRSPNPRTPRAPRSATAPRPPRTPRRKPAIACLTPIDPALDPALDSDDES